jgi:hypothetical protein
MELEYKKLQAKLDLTHKEEENWKASIKAGGLLLKRAEGRFYWAPVLGALAGIVPPHVQITRMSGNLAPDVAKHCAITLNGIAAGTEPRNDAEDFRTALTDQFSSKYLGVTASFKALEETANLVTSDGKSLRAVEFSINIQFHVRDEPGQPYRSHKSS